MKNRYKELFRQGKNLFAEKSPVVIDKYVIQQDSQTGRALAQVKLLNVSEKVIIACKISVRAFEISGKETRGVESFQYLDLSAKPGEFFGSKVPVMLPDASSRKISVSAIEAVFEDGSVWQNDPADWSPISERRELINYFGDPELVKQYEIEAGGNCRFVPEKENGLFLCTCGTVNSASWDSCSSCHRSYDYLYGILTSDTLESDKEARLLKEAEERKAEEIKAEKRRKIIKILTPIAAAGLVAIILCNTVFKVPIANAKAYREASNLFESEEYYEASQIYKSLGAYKDSAEKYSEATYSYASTLFDQEKYDEAAKYYGSIGDYSNAKDRMMTSKYLNAVQLFKKELYEEAIKKFRELSGYKNSDAMITKCKENYIIGRLSDTSDYDETFFTYLKSLKSEDPSVACYIVTEDPKLSVYQEPSADSTYISSIFSGKFVVTFDTETDIRDGFLEIDPSIYRGYLTENKGYISMDGLRDVTDCAQEIYEHESGNTFSFFTSQDVLIIDSGEKVSFNITMDYSRATLYCYGDDDLTITHGSFNKNRVVTYSVKGSKPGAYNIFFTNSKTSDILSVLVVVVDKP